MKLKLIGVRYIAVGGQTKARRLTRRVGQTRGPWSDREGSSDQDAPSDEGRWSDHHGSSDRDRLSYQPGFSEKWAGQEGF